MDELKRQKIIDKLNEVAKSDDYEMAHSVADGVLCEVLIALGYEDIVEAWNKVGKWYA